MAGKRRKPEQLIVFSKPELLAKINSIQSLRDRALVCFIYLTGARISEIVGTNTQGIDKDIKIEPLRKENIEIIIDRDLILIHNVACLKRKKGVPRRTIPIIIKQEQPLIGYFMKYYYTLQMGDPLFNISRIQAWRIISKEMGVFNHFLIHIRCSHLAVHKNFTDLDLMKFRGWSNTRYAATYVHLNYTDIANKMR